MTESQKINGTQRDLGKLEGRLDGLEVKVADIDRHVSKLEAKLSTKIDQMKDDVISIKMATQTNKWKLAVMGGLLTGSAAGGAGLTKLIGLLFK